MHIRLLTLKVKPEYVDSFKKISSDALASAGRMAGVLHFDMFQKQENPREFVIFEAYMHEQARNEYLASDQFLRWRAQTSFMFSEALESAPYHGVFLDGKACN
ncbi:MAG: antibiotic biosynthesis monooxygenase [Microscillaceae bacterium]|jgi:quinol monooxygenase YgiN|nr:antibiotic biosynthesis monooxygenase [Microscillaceae bacterium]